MAREKLLLLSVAILSLISSGRNCALAHEDGSNVSQTPQSLVSREQLLQAADEALESRRFTEANDLLAQVEAHDGSVASSATKLLRTEWLIAVERAAEAQELLRSITDEPRFHCRIESARIVSLLQLNSLMAADAMIAGEDKRCDQEPAYLRSVGRLHLARGRPRDAVAALDGARRLAPAEPAILGDLGVAQIAAGEPAIAIRTLSAMANGKGDLPEVRLNLDYARAMLGEKPVRALSDDDEFWSRRLQFAGLGARQDGRSELAASLFAEALIARPRHDDTLWKQYADAVGGRRNGEQ